MSALSWPQSKAPLRGIIPPLVTPLLTSQSLDVHGTKKLLDYVIDDGVCGVFLLGTTGEFPSLSLNLRKEFIKLCCSFVDGRIPVLVGISDSCLEISVELAQVAKEAGADAIVLTTPSYFPLSPTEVHSYVVDMLDRVDLPVMLYNMPGLTKVWLDIETVERLAAYAQIVGIKDSSGDLDYFGKLCKLRNRLRPDWTVMIGPEHLTRQAMILGGDGGVNGGANVLPELFVMLHTAISRSDKTKQADQLQELVESFQKIYTMAGSCSGFPYIATTKTALSINKICNNAMSSPLHPLDDETSKQIGIIVKDIKERIKEVDL